MTINSSSNLSSTARTDENRSTTTPGTGTNTSGSAGAAQADSDTLTAYAELKELKAQEKELKAQIAAKEDLLKIKIGNYSTMQANGNTLFTWKAQSSSRFDSSAFKNAHPDLYRQYTKTSETRVLRLK